VIEVLLSEIVPFGGVVARLTSVRRAAKAHRTKVAKIRGLKEPDSETDFFFMEGYDYSRQFVTNRRNGLPSAQKRT
jgi:hypothetical protein